MVAGGGGGGGLAEAEELLYGEGRTLLGIQLPEVVWVVVGGVVVGVAVVVGVVGRVEGRLVGLGAHLEESVHHGGWRRLAIGFTD